MLLNLNVIVRILIEFIILADYKYGNDYHSITRTIYGYGYCVNDLEN
jgi:hypothetical protein